MNQERIKQVGFSAEKEEIFLRRLDNRNRRVNLEQELKTQLAEDFGLVEFTLKYKINSDGKIVDIISGQEIVELTSRGGIKEETESIGKIEEGLKNNPEKTFIHFSPKNENLGYPNNCVDFWRVVDDEVVWNRMVVKNNFEEMNKTRQVLSGEEKVENEMEILKSPIGVELKLAEVFDFFRLSEEKNITDLNKIEAVVEKYLEQFENEFGEKLTEDQELIFRLYSICHEASKRESEQRIMKRSELEIYMYGIMKEIKVEKSSGCAATTTVGSFGEKIGYYVLSNGEVKKGVVPEGFKECKKCGCWYQGEKCPFC
ncbi:MAG: hypothetical protein PHE32_01060 [Candidatus Shapirobacteria bacterium]|nr:hypothetical protein [Candidatus Shapirobacteria bacterium]MDD4410282.1 hypothetical protein [Candidatus Shapirobacteria bacterium]